MATPIQENLVAKNKAYASSFTEGHLALPPAKKYAVGSFPLPSFLPSSFLLLPIHPTNKNK
jgi:hypothetical protein